MELWVPPPVSVPRILIRTGPGLPPDLKVTVNLKCLVEYLMG